LTDLIGVISARTASKVWALLRKPTLPTAFVVEDDLLATGGQGETLGLVLELADMSPTFCGSATRGRVAATVEAVVVVAVDGKVALRHDRCGKAACRGLCPAAHPHGHGIGLVGNALLLDMFIAQAGFERPA
jgi:hypothetical protein